MKDKIFKKDTHMFIHKKRPAKPVSFVQRIMILILTNRAVLRLLTKSV